MGAGDTSWLVKARAEMNPRGLRLHRVERTDGGATRRVAGKGLREDVYAKDGGAKYDATT